MLRAAPRVAILLHNQATALLPWQGRFFLRDGF
jgi:hypothetical protein